MTIPGRPSPFDTGSTTPTLVLVKRAQAGERQAIEALYARYLPRLRAWARGRLPAGIRGPMDTEDFVQDALARTLNHLPNLEPERPGCFQAYTRQAILNAIRDQIRRARPQRLDSRMMAEKAAPGISPLEEVIGREAVAAYDAALLELSETDREAVVARIELQCSYEEIAQILGKNSPDAARMTVKRALVSLAKTMAAKGLTPSV